jgi:hypothetical protein
MIKHLIVSGITIVILLATFSSAIGFQSKKLNTKIETPLYKIRVSDALEKNEVTTAATYIRQNEQFNIPLPKIQEGILSKLSNMLKNNKILKNMFINILKKGQQGQLNQQVMEKLISKINRGYIPLSVIAKMTRGTTPNPWTYIPKTCLNPICWWIYLWMIFFFSAWWSCFPIGCGGS